MRRNTHTHLFPFGNTGAPPAIGIGDEPKAAPAAAEEEALVAPPAPPPPPPGVVADGGIGDESGLLPVAVGSAVGDEPSKEQQKVEFKKLKSAFKNEKNPC